MESLKVNVEGLSGEEKQNVVWLLNSLGFVNGYKSIDFYSYLYACFDTKEKYAGTIQFGNSAKTFGKSTFKEISISELRDLVHAKKNSENEKEMNILDEGRYVEKEYINKTTDEYRKTADVVSGEQWTGLVCGVGINDVKGFSQTRVYQQWVDMLKRCYSETTKKRRPTYELSICDQRWLRLSNFIADEKILNPMGHKDWCLDKDILVRGNKVYSLSTCSIVPCEINNLFVKNNIKRGSLPIGVCYESRMNKFRACISIKSKPIKLGSYSTVIEAFNAYKVAKEFEIKRLAEKYKKQIDIKVYKALNDYEVSIND